jgi:hypothetical protein
MVAAPKQTLGSCVLLKSIAHTHSVQTLADCIF